MWFNLSESSICFSQMISFAFLKHLILKAGKPVYCWKSCLRTNFAISTILSKAFSAFELLKKAPFNSMGKRIAGFSYLEFSFLFILFIIWSPSLVLNKVLWRWLMPYEKYEIGFEYDYIRPAFITLNFSIITSFLT